MQTLPRINDTQEPDRGLLDQAQVVSLEASLDRGTTFERTRVWHTPHQFTLDFAVIELQQQPGTLPCARRESPERDPPVEPIASKHVRRERLRDPAGPLRCPGCGAKRSKKS